MWRPVEEQGKFVGMSKSQPALTGISPEGCCLLLLEFETGERRKLDLMPFIARGGAYERLADDEYAALARIIDGGLAIGWPEGQEVYPEALFDLSVPLV